MNVVPALMILSAHKNCDKSVLHLNFEEILMSKEAMNLPRSSLETCQLIQKKNKKILETRSFSGRGKAITEVSKKVRKMTY